MEKIRPNYRLRFGTEVAASPQAFSFFPQIYHYSLLSPKPSITGKPFLRETDLARGVYIPVRMGFSEKVFPVC